MGAEEPVWFWDRRLGSPDASLLSFSPRLPLPFPQSLFLPTDEGVGTPEPDLSSQCLSGLSLPEGKNLSRVPNSLSAM